MSLARPQRHRFPRGPGASYRRPRKTPEKNIQRPLMLLSPFSPHSCRICPHTHCGRRICDTFAAFPPYFKRLSRHDRDHALIDETVISDAKQEAGARGLASKEKRMPLMELGRAAVAASATLAIAFFAVPASAATTQTKFRIDAAGRRKRTVFSSRHAAKRSARRAR